MHNPESFPENDTLKLLWDFKIQTDQLISVKQSDQVIVNNNTKKRACWIVDLASPADRWVKLKESEKRDKYVNLARELRKLRNMKVTVIPIVIGVLGTATKILVQELEDL